MPVGRFVLDVHGESRAHLARRRTMVCAVLQIINHLQDCGKDYRNLDRVYIPLDALTAAGANVEALGAPTRDAAASGCLHRTRRAHRALLRRGRATSPARSRDMRLALGDRRDRHARAATSSGCLRSRDPLTRERASRQARRRLAWASWRVAKGWFSASCRALRHGPATIN